MIITTIMLTACDNTANTSDLSQYIAHIKSTTQHAIPTLTTITQIDALVYKQDNIQRNPFTPSLKVENKPAQRLNTNRIKEPLESIALSHLHMVGTVQIDSLFWALIKDDENHLYRVKKGNYLGENAGKITHIDTATIELIEIISNEQGLFSENHAKLLLTQ
jgi:type IV pilus assembly protein PilP